ncbi:MAG: hypothetical protein MZU95_00005 [Desulfomicrobium escambiense]|nr:hypothetical protein [Desulfomicrobium escambiense]
MQAIGLPKEKLCTHCWDGSSYLLSLTVIHEHFQYYNYGEISIPTDGSGSIVTPFSAGGYANEYMQMQTNWKILQFQPGTDFSETTPNLAGDFCSSVPIQGHKKYACPVTVRTTFFDTSLLGIDGFRKRMK